MTTYYVRADGTAANKASATSAASAATSMSMAVFNASTFSADDVIRFSNLGGEFTSALVVPSSGTNGHPIRYIADSGIVVIKSITTSCISVGTRTDFEIDGFIARLAGSADSSKALAQYGTTQRAKFKNLTLDIASCTATTKYHVTSTGTTIGCEFENITRIGTATGRSFYFSGTGNQNLSVDGLYGAGSTSYSVSITNVAGLSLANVEFSSHAVGVSLTAITGVLSIDGITVSDSTTGIELYASTLSEGSAIGNFSSDTTTSVPIIIDGSSGVDVVGANISGARGAAGVWITNSSSDIIVADSTVEDGSQDGFGTYGATGATFKRNVSRGNGTPASTADGDGFTCHFADTVDYLGNVSQGNTCSGFGLAGTSSGLLVGNVSFNNGTGENQVRGEIYIATTGGPGWTIRNNIVYNDFGYPLVYAGGSAVFTFDYNAWISNLGPTEDAFQLGGVGYSWAEWVAAGHDANGIYIHIVGNGTYAVYLGAAPTVLAQMLTYCPVLSTGKLAGRSDNPLINAGTWITGVNDTGEPDVWGNYVHRLPNIGADQGAGSPGSIQIVFEVES